MKRYDQIDHTADLAARIYGKDIPELFENAAFAMFDMMADTEGVDLSEATQVEVEAPDLESLLVAWLNELLFILEDRKLLPVVFKVIFLGDGKLVAEVKGQKAEKDRVHTEIKAATYHDIAIEKTSKGCEVTIVFDV
jgi:SHS2 domain-containing protein